MERALVSSGKDSAKDKPHYHGHRQRLKDRFLKNPSSLPDYEFLELILCLIYPRQDVKPKAKALMAEYGTLSRVLHAQGQVSPQLAFIFQLMNESSRRLLHEDLTGGSLLNNAHRVIEYCHSTMAFACGAIPPVLFGPQIYAHLR